MTRPDPLHRQQLKSMGGGWGGSPKRAEEKRSQKDDRRAQATGSEEGFGQRPDINVPLSERA